MPPSSPTIAALIGLNFKIADKGARNLQLMQIPTEDETQLFPTCLLGCDNCPSARFGAKLQDFCGVALLSKVTLSLNQSGPWKMEKKVVLLESFLLHNTAAGPVLGPTVWIY